MENILFIARAETHRLPLCLESCGAAPTEVSRHGQKIVGVGHFRIPLEHGFEVEHHVGQAHDVGMSGARHPIFCRGQVVVRPHVLGIERRSIVDFAEGFLKFIVFDVIPGQEAVRGGIAQCVRR